MNPEEFKIQVLPLKQKLFRLSLRLLGHLEEAEDAVQDTMMKLWVKREDLANYQSVEALAVVMSRNICLDKMRSKAFQSEKFPANREAIAQSNPEEMMEKRDMALLIRNIVDHLPEQQKTILHLRDIEGLEYGEIAEIMEMNINAIRVNLSRARKKVRDTVLKIQDYELARN